eukprot:942115-Prorocentrum_lima.AAC.1
MNAPATKLIYSSGASEYYAMVLGSACGLGLQSSMADWGVQASLAVCTDLAAAKDIGSRRCLGKLRH